MSTDDKRVQDSLEQIQVQVNNWLQGKSYGPDGRTQGTPERDVAFLLNHITDLQIEAREKNAWEGRYNALLEEAEASRPREISGGDASRGIASGTVALDVNGYPWSCDEGGWWRLAKDALRGKRSELHPLLAPYTIIHTPMRNS